LTRIQAEGDNRTVKQVEKAILAAEERIKTKLDKAKDQP
jgi:hypothetical protein